MQGFLPEAGARAVSRLSGVSQVTGRRGGQLSEGPGSPAPSTCRGREPFGLRPHHPPGTTAGQQPSRRREARFQFSIRRVSLMCPCLGRWGFGVAHPKEKWDFSVGMMIFF